MFPPCLAALKLHFWAHVTNAVKCSLLVKFHFMLKIAEGNHRFLKILAHFRCLGK